MKRRVIFLKIKDIFIALILFSTATKLLLPVSGFAHELSFRAGASTANITPSLGDGIAGGWMPLPLATHIHDELHVRSLVLDDGKGRLVIVVVDNVELPREVFTETGLEIKNKSPFKKSFTIGLANGGYGYLPTSEQHQLGGYETWLTVNKVEKEASRMIVAEILKLFDKIDE